MPVFGCWNTTLRTGYKLFAWMEFKKNKNKNKKKYNLRKN